eukprot:1153550-Pelagomonas_calceolata.AAC.2
MHASIRPCMQVSRTGLHRQPGWCITHFRSCSGQCPLREGPHKAPPDPHPYAAGAHCLGVLFMVAQKWEPVFVIE